MTNIINKEQTISSFEIAQITGKNTLTCLGTSELWNQRGRKCINPNLDLY